MGRSARRTPTFDSMEGRILLSSGLKDPAAAAMVERIRSSLSHFALTGTLVGIPFGSIGSNGITVSSFNMTGKVQSMGKVTGSLALTDTLISPGRQPNLSNATITLSNSRGSVQIKTAESPSNRYVFIVTSGSGAYASVYGSGTAVIHYSAHTHEYQVVLHSTAG